MVRRRDHHRVHTLVAQQIAIVLVLLRVGSRFLERKVHVIFPQVANGNSLVTASFEKRVVNLVAPVSNADIPQTDALVGAENFGVAECGCKSSAARQVTTGE